MKRGAHLGDADLRDTHLGDALCPLTRGADLRWADLRRADLRRADLRRADLRRADLRRADLRRANLKGANLEGAEMRGANLESVRGLEWAQAGNQYHMLGVKIGGGSYDLLRVSSLHFGPSRKTLEAGQL